MTFKKQWLNYNDVDVEGEESLCSQHHDIIHICLVTLKIKPKGHSCSRLVFYRPGRKIRLTIPLSISDFLMQLSSLQPIFEQPHKITLAQSEPIIIVSITDNRPQN